MSPNVERLGSWAFANSKNLRTFPIPAKITEISEGAFANIHLPGQVSIAETVEIIGDSAFYGCTNLKKVSFVGTPKLTSIGTQAFYNTNVQSFNVPRNVKNIKKHSQSSPKT